MRLNFIVEPFITLVSFIILIASAMVFTWISSNEALLCSYLLTPHTQTSWSLAIDPSARLIIFEVLSGFEILLVLQLLQYLLFCNESHERIHSIIAKPRLYIDKHGKIFNHNINRL